MARSVLYLDIETLPCLDPQSRIDAAARVTPPASMSKPETIAAWERDQKPALVDEKWRKTALDGTHGHLLSVAWAIDDGPVTLCYGGHGYEGINVSQLEEVEGTFLAHVITELHDSLDSAGVRRPETPVLCAFHADFDVRFIFQRAAILGERLPSWWPINVAPWKGDVFDPMTTWAGLKGTISQDRLAKALDIKGDENFDGSMVYDAWANRQHDRIGSYNCTDVKTLREIHKRLCVTGVC